MQKEMVNKFKGDANSGSAKKQINKINPAADVGATAEPDEPSRDQFRSVHKAQDLMEFNDDAGLKPNKTGGKFIH